MHTVIITSSPFTGIHNVLLTLNHMQLGGLQLHDRYHGSMVSSVTVLGSTLRISHSYSGGKVL